MQALNSISSLFNNSCDVNTVKYHQVIILQSVMARIVLCCLQGNQTVMIARRRILAGEEVTDFYGSHYFQSSRGERQALLGFPCQCMPCSDNWPLLRNLPTFTKAHQTTHCSQGRVQVYLSMMESEAGLQSSLIFSEGPIKTKSPVVLSKRATGDFSEQHEGPADI